MSHKFNFSTLFTFLSLFVEDDFFFTTQKKKKLFTRGDTRSSLDVDYQTRQEGSTILSGVLFLQCRLLLSHTIYVIQALERFYLFSRMVLRCCILYNCIDQSACARSMCLIVQLNSAIKKKMPEKFLSKICLNNKNQFFIFILY